MASAPLAAANKLLSKTLTTPSLTERLASGQFPIIDPSAVESMREQQALSVHNTGNEKMDNKRW